MPDRFAFGPFVYPDDGSVLDGMSIDVGDTERLVLYGPNGGGKSTIVRLMAGTIGDGDGPSTSYLPQNPYMFRTTVRANLVLGLTVDETPVAIELATGLGLGDRLDSDARDLSGGEVQRIALARTLASAAPLVLLDEPLAPVDAANRHAVARLIRERTAGRALVCVTHSIETVVELADRLAIVDGGEILQDGTAADVLTNPASEAVARIVGVGNVVTGTVTGAGDGMATVDCGSFVLMVVSDDAVVDDTIRVRFGAETVALYADEPTGGSQRNVIAGTIDDIIERGRLAEVIIDAGVPIAALVTPGALDALELDRGDRVWAAVKTASLSVTRLDT